LTEVYLPSGRVSVLIKSVTPALLSFNSISCDDLTFINDTFAECSYSQSNSILYQIGLESGSFIMNTHVVILVFFLLMLVHLLILPFYLCKRKSESSSC